MVIIILTNKEKEIVKDLYVNKKFSVKQILIVLDNPNITKSSVSHVIQRNGWTRKTPSPKLTQEEKEFILKKINEGLNCAEIGRLLGYSNKRINGFIRKQGLHSYLEKRKKLNQSEIEDIKTMYLNKCTGKQILEKYCDRISSENTIIKIAREEGCKIRPNGQISRSLNENFFEDINTEEKAYFLGWLLSDGYVIGTSKKKTYPIGIDVKIEDKYILEEFKKALSLDLKAPLLDQVRKPSVNSEKNLRNRKTYQSRLMFHSKKMTEDLKKYGVVPRKSHTIRFPKEISERLIHHIIRGIFDGDGCISKQRISFYGNENMVNDIKNVLIKTIKINDVKVFNTGTCFGFTFSSKKDVESFYHYIYDDATIFLKRKKERFEKLDFI